MDFDQICVKMILAMSCFKIKSEPAFAVMLCPHSLVRFGD